MSRIKHSNVSIFVPHNGCKNNCSFCNQKTITGQSYQPSIEDVKSSIEIAIKSGNVDAENSEIAFFGGSFTAIDRKYMQSLLSVASEYVENKLFSGIRISTRPDCIDDNILNILKAYNVSSIELGAQSMDDEVLKANNRGHFSSDVINSSKLIKKHGFSLGLQMMIGLYKASKETDILTAEKLIDLNPDTVRVYPTVVLEGTYLSELYRQGEYTALELDDAVELCSLLLDMFNKHNVNVIKIGLHSSTDVEKYFVAGAYHPALRELVEGKLLYNKLINILIDGDYGNDIFVHINPRQVSKLIGQNRRNLLRLKNLNYNVKIVQDDSLSGYELEVKNSR